MESPLFLHVQQRLGRAAQRKPTDDEAAEIAFAWRQLAGDDGGGGASSGAAGSAPGPATPAPTVGPRHVKVALRALGFGVKKADVAELLREHGLPPDAELDWPLFREVVSAKVTERGPTDEVRRAFELFDLSRAGRITLQDLAAVARQLGLDVEEGELRDMIGEFDADGDGAISADEFRAIVTAAAGGGAAAEAEGQGEQEQEEAAARQE